MSGPIVGHVVCDPCGNRVVGTVTREPGYFEYRPRHVVAISKGTVVVRHRWKAEGESNVATIDVACSHCTHHGGRLAFDVAELLEKVRKLPPEAAPVIVRARRCG